MYPLLNNEAMNNDGRHPLSWPNPSTPAYHYQPPKSGTQAWGD